MEVGEVPKGIRWSAEAGGPPKVRIGGVSGRGRGPTHQPYPAFVMNQLGINHTGLVGHQPYLDLVMNQLASTILGR